MRELSILDIAELKLPLGYRLVAMRPASLDNPGEAHLSIVVGTHPTANKMATWLYNWQSRGFCWGNYFTIKDSSDIQRAFHDFLTRRTIYENKDAVLLTKDEIATICAALRQDSESREDHTRLIAKLTGAQVPV